jgi:hypothetical protein
MSWESFWLGYMIGTLVLMLVGAILWLISLRLQGANR